MRDKMLGGPESLSPVLAGTPATPATRQSIAGSLGDWRTARQPDPEQSGHDRPDLQSEADDRPRQGPGGLPKVTSPPGPGARVAAARSLPSYIPARPSVRPSST